MKKKLLYISNQHEIVLKFIIFCFTAFLIIKMLPHQVRYKFDYSISKPWTEKDLIAPFDFAVLKNKDSLNAEKRILLLNATLFFERDTAVKEQVLQRAIARIDPADKHNAELLKQEISILASELYKNGVADESARTISFGQARIIKGVDLIPANNFIFEDDAVNELARIAKEKHIDAPDMAISLLAPLVSNDLTIDKVMTDRFKDELLRSVSETRGMVKKGDLIIAKGEVVTREKYQELESLSQLQKSMPVPINMYL
jgi:membrane-associated HD superfamily phosphohydrolase